MFPMRKETIVLEQSITCPDQVFVCIPRTNFLERLSIRFLNQPTHHRVRLDKLGSFVFQMCDGSHDVRQIESRVREYFGREAAPIRERLITFLIIIEANDWINWKGP
ncbi:PqqD family protein [Shimazuella kribbensis]|uniref:PqqD family protein n=1 Tax=Shimazuella kribbensis TaxID=139808 RepID=UPI0014716AA9|nr:PqqD family protein [Shimazuella kribbensis]